MAGPQVHDLLAVNGDSDGGTVFVAFFEVFRKGGLDPFETRFTGALYKHVGHVELLPESRTNLFFHSMRMHAARTRATFPMSVSSERRMSAGIYAGVSAPPQLDPAPAVQP